MHAPDSVLSKFSKFDAAMQLDLFKQFYTEGLEEIKYLLQQFDQNSSSEAIKSSENVIGQKHINIVDPLCSIFNLNMMDDILEIMPQSSIFIKVTGSSGCSSIQYINSIFFQLKEYIDSIKIESVLSSSFAEKLSALNSILGKTERQIVMIFFNFHHFTSKECQSLLYTIFNAKKNLTFVTIGSKVNSSDHLEKRLKSRMGRKTICFLPSLKLDQIIIQLEAYLSSDKPSTKVKKNWNIHISKVLRSTNVKILLEKFCEISIFAHFRKFVIKLASEVCKKKFFDCSVFESSFNSILDESSYLLQDQNLIETAFFSCIYAYANKNLTAFTFYDIYKCKY
ncbi:MAG: origin recognition complex subunit 4 [Paramarteilia canceri]